MYICKCCGLTFDEPSRWYEERGAGLQPFLEEWSGCPACLGYYEEANECDICGEAYVASEVREGVCDCCVQKYGNDIETCYRISGDECDKESVKLNGFLAWAFSDSDIEAILYEALENEQKKTHTRIDCKDYINSDRGWFLSKLNKFKLNKKGDKK